MRRRPPARRAASIADPTVPVPWPLPFRVRFYTRGSATNSRCSTLSTPLTGDLLRNVDRFGLELPCRQTTACGSRMPTAMRKREGYKSGIELLQGTLDMLILQTLRRGPQHGYGIGQAIRSGSGEVLQAETGSLYPALHRLEKQGWIKSE